MIVAFVLSSKFLLTRSVLSSLSLRGPNQHILHLNRNISISYTQNLRIYKKHIGWILGIDYLNIYNVNAFWLSFSKHENYLSFLYPWRGSTLLGYTPKNTLVSYSYPTQLRKQIRRSIPGRYFHSSCLLSCSIQSIGRLTILKVTLLVASSVNSQILC